MSLLIKRNKILQVVFRAVRNGNEITIGCYVMNNGFTTSIADDTGNHVPHFEVYGAISLITFDTLCVDIMSHIIYW